MLGGPTLEIWDGGGFQDDQDISRSTWTVTTWISTFNLLKPSIIKSIYRYRNSFLYSKCCLSCRADNREGYKTIFKHGDDLRQDQLILQIITLFDRILQQENLDLKLTPYSVLATSSRHGFVQFIDGTPVAEILRAERSIQNFLRASAPCETGPFGIAPEVMSNYVKSCAGYCVITYLLGVGDRHLDNLLMTKTGKLFHIDFGYILGRDPKSQLHSKCNPKAFSTKYNSK